MRALRDFNIPKIITDDIPVFLGLIGDLFPSLDVPRKRNIEFEKMCQAAAVDMKLQPEQGFILKVRSMNTISCNSLNNQMKKNKTEFLCNICR